MIQNTRTIFELGQASFLKKMMLYFSISVLLNTSLFPTVQRYIDRADAAHWQIDSSLLELMADNLFGINDLEADLPDEGDDVRSSIDYLSIRTCWALDNSYRTQNRKVPTNNTFLDYPTLKKFTPPPRHLFS